MTTAVSPRCGACDSTGTVLVEGGMPDEQVTEECPVCEPEYCQLRVCSGLPRHAEGGCAVAELGVMAA